MAYGLKKLIIINGYVAEVTITKDDNRKALTFYPGMGKMPVTRNFDEADLSGAESFLSGLGNLVTLDKGDILKTIKILGNISTMQTFNPDITKTTWQFE